MPNPKYKHSRARTRMRRSHWNLAAVGTVECPRCHESKLPHRACAACGHYNGREVVKVEEKA